MGPFKNANSPLLKYFISCYVKILFSIFYSLYINVYSAQKDINLPTLMPYFHNCIYYYIKKNINYKSRMHLVFSATFVGELTSFLPRLRVLLSLALGSWLPWYHPGSRRYCISGMVTLLPMSFSFYMCYFIDDKSAHRTSSVNKSDKQFLGNRTTSVLFTQGRLLPSRNFLWKYYSCTEDFQSRNKKKSQNIKHDTLSET